MFKPYRLLLPAACALLLPACEPTAEHPPGYGEWPHHQGDLAASKYAPLDQITPENFERLEVAWRWESADRRLGDVYDTGTYVATPLKVGDRLYTATSHGQVVALDPATGQQLWLHDPRSWAEEMPTQLPRHTRGVEYWTDGEIERIFIATLGKQLVSIDAATGKPDPAFGVNGVVDLKNDLGDGDWVTAHLGHRAPPLVVRDAVVVGSGVHDYISEMRNPPGHVRAYDARTGALKWRFDTIPPKGAPFADTWPEDTIEKQGNTNVWTYLSADEELGHVYLPTSTPTNDYYGGERHGDNLFAESVVAVDVETGERVWHFQTVHHGIWDYDIASAPNVIDVEIDGQPRKVLAQMSKTAFAYVFDRVTGEPIWPIEERPVPQSTVPGEKTAATQPFPTKPAPFDRQGVTEDDLIDFTPELRAEALEIAAQFRLGPIFEPLIVEGDGGKLATFVVPGAGGGASYPGASWDPETGVLYVESKTRPTTMAVVKPETGQSVTFGLPESGQSDFAYEVKYHSTDGPRGLPLLKPPYRRLTAIDMKTGEHVFQVPQGQGPTDHPALAGLDLGPLGTAYRGVSAGGIVVTKTMLIGFVAKDRPYGADAYPAGAWLRAQDKATGEVLAEIEVDRTLQGSPMTYMHGGRQYIAIAGGGRGEPQELLAFALPAQ